MWSPESSEEWGEQRVRPLAHVDLRDQVAATRSCSVCRIGLRRIKGIQREDWPIASIDDVFCHTAIDCSAM